MDSEYMHDCLLVTMRKQATSEGGRERDRERKGKEEKGENSPMRWRAVKAKDRSDRSGKNEGNDGFRGR